MTEKSPVRSVRSFVNRDGRVTGSQKRALRELLPNFSISKEKLADVSTEFGRIRPVYFEIGFGNGVNLVKQAKFRPSCNFVGCEIYRSGIGRTLAQIDAMALDNIRIIVGDAVEMIARFPSKSLDGVFIFFPDPWPKKRHHKRRLINKLFLRTLARKMKDHALLFMATDDRSYAYEIIDFVEYDELLKNVAGSSSFAPRPSWREVTRFENRARSQGNPIFEIIAGLRTGIFTHKIEE